MASFWALLRLATYWVEPTRPSSSAPHQANRRWFVVCRLARDTASATSSNDAEPDPLSLMPGPASTLSRCAPTTTTLPGSPFLVSARMLTVRRISDSVLVNTCSVIVGPSRPWSTIASPSA